MKKRSVKIFVGNDPTNLERRINDWVAQSNVLIINASISEPEEENYTVIVVYEQL